MDIVERLRQEIGGYTDTDIEKAEADMKEAAAEIEDLRIKVKILEMDYRNSIQESLILGGAWKSGVDNIERLREALHHCIKALAEFEKDSNLPTEQFQDNVVFKLKGYLLGALDNARLATGE